jgi:hypothetical protein
MRFHNDPGYYVAHYTSCETALDCILKNRSIKIGPLIKTNDPRETKMWNFGIGSSYSDQINPTSKEIEELAGHNVDFNRILRNGYKALCVSQDKENAFKLDFSARSYCKPRMWAQYGGNHHGVCLLFDKQILHNTLEHKFGKGILYSGSVTYGDFDDVRTKGWDEYMDAFLLSGDDILKNGLEIALQRHSEKYHDVFFFHKNKDWENESEYRWIIHGHNNDPEFIPIEDILSAIVLGVDFPMEHLKQVHEYCKEWEVFLSRIIWHNGKPIVQWFDPMDLDSTEFKVALEFYSLKLPD